MEIKRFVCNMIRENTYVVSDDTREAVIIDCGAYYEEERKAIKQYIDDNKLQPKHLIATHGHVDHHLGDRFVYDTWGLKPEVGEADEDFMNRLPEQARQLFEMELSDDDFAPVGRYLMPADTISFGHTTFKIIETPGHSPGGLCFYSEADKTLFTGDTLFRGSIGRSDFDGGSMFLIIQSLRVLSQLPDDTVVLPGHGERTTIGYEVATNPYLDR
jgi:glyoxylase-like metal-dependent hydrolase (beta-lactamase superfamily II)